MTTLKRTWYKLIMKLTATQIKTLNKVLPHITGACMCSPSSKTCIYWKNVDKKEDWQTAEIIKEIKKL